MKRLDLGRNVFAVEGVPGSGATTLARNLADELGGSMISVGESVRKIAADRRDSDYGQIIYDHLTNPDLTARDNLLQDNLICGLIRKLYGKAEDEVDTLILEGLPRTIAQIRFLTQFAASTDRHFLGVIVPNIDDVTAASRVFMRGRKKPERAVSHEAACQSVLGYRQRGSGVLTMLQHMGVPIIPVETTGTKQDTCSQAVFELERIASGLSASR